MNVFDPETVIATFGLIGILLIVFAESGLLIGFFLPGDSLLFTAGILVATDQCSTTCSAASCGASAFP